jgi:hypothetical protein
MGKMFLQQFKENSAGSDKQAPKPASSWPGFGAFWHSIDQAKWT